MNIHNNKVFKQKPNKGFNKFNLNKDIVLNILKLGYKIPTPIQRKVIPELLSGFNVIAKSRTGSGKSASFIIPVLEKLKSHSEIVGARAIVLSPTRELAKQTLDFFYKLGKGMNIKFAVMTGGDKIEGQFEKLATNPDVIIATPGRLAHHLEEGSINLKKVELIIIDEADKLIEQGFEEQINQIIKACPLSKQIGLFSATIPERLANFMRLGIKDYKLITLEDENQIPDTLKLHMIACRTDQKNTALVSLLKECIDSNVENTLVFCPTKYHCEYLHEYLKCYGINTLTIYGNMDQSLRDENFSKFKKKEITIMLVTDVAARGLDIPRLENVINYDFPDKAKLFIHRVGRTARAGKFGKVISLVTNVDLPYLMDTKLIIGRPIVYKYDPLKDKEDCEFISYGYIPKSSYERAQACLMEYYKSRIDFEEMDKSTKNANIKREVFKEKPSGAGIRNAKEIASMEVGVSPLYYNDKLVEEKIDENDNKLADLLKTFKPRKTVFEQLNTETNLSYKVVGEFRNNNKRYLNKKEFEKRREELQESTMDQLSSNKSKKVSKIEDLDDFEEDEYDDDDEIIEEKSINEKPIETKSNEFLGKKHKRVQHNELVKKSQYISLKQDPKLSASLWGNEGPLALNELTLNLCPDDLVEKKKSKYVWDEKRKRYVSGVSDKNGNLVRKNEAGVKIKVDEKRISSYKKWMSKTKIRVQRTGEVEDTNLVHSASQKFKDRKSMKGNHKAKSDIKSYDQLVKERKDTGKKKFKFAGQVRALKEKKIQDRVHGNNKSYALVKKKVGAGYKHKRKNNK